MDDSILRTIKKLLGLDPSYTVFDTDVIMHVNAVLSNLTQLGVGPPTGFMITDDTATWEDFLGEETELNNVKTLIYMKVKMVFDPPATGPAMAAYEKMIQEQEWRINVSRESKHYVNPNTPQIDFGNGLREPVIDGGIG